MIRYSKEHEWIRVEGEVATVGITQYAQEQLGDVVFVEVPQAGRKVAKGEACAVVESVKAASDIPAPLSGDIVETNAALNDAPEKVNQDPYRAWLFRLKPGDRSEQAGLLEAAAYRKSVTSDA